MFDAESKQAAEEAEDEAAKNKILNKKMPRRSLILRNRLALVKINKGGEEASLEDLTPYKNYNAGGLLVPRKKPVIKECVQRTLVRPSLWPIRQLATTGRGRRVGVISGKCTLYNASAGTSRSVSAWWSAPSPCA